MTPHYVEAHTHTDIHMHTLSRSVPFSSTPSPLACQELGTVKLISSGSGEADSLMGVLGCNVTPTQPPPITTPPPPFFFFFGESWAKLIRAGTRRRLTAVPDADELMDTVRLFSQSPTPWCSGAARGNLGSVGSARHTPFEKHASKHVLMHLAASQPRQVNGWASDSGLYIASAPSIVKFHAAYMLVTTPIYIICNADITLA